VAVVARRVVVYILAVFEQNWLQMWVRAQDAGQLSPAVAAKADNPDLSSHWLNIHLNE
jgi:hypothetical protein